MLRLRAEKRALCVRKSLFAIAIVCVGLSVSWGQEANSRPMTQIYHIARFAKNKEAAQLFARLAEFSIRLLEWSDTDRPSVIAVQKRLKGESYQQTSLGSGQNELTGAEATSVVNTGYSSLRSPRLLSVDIGKDISVRQSPAALTLVRGGVYPLPVILQPSESPVRSEKLVRLSSPLSERVFSVRLSLGQSEGVLLPLVASSTKTKSIDVKIDIEGRSEIVPLPVRVVEPGRLRLRVIDENRSPTAARVSVVGSDGRAYTPPGAQARVTNADYGQPYGGDYYFYTSGELELSVPSGVARIEVLKGLEYTPVLRQVEILAGRVASVHVRLEKLWDLRQQGWYSGDIHVHANIYDDRSITPEDVLLIAKGEDLNVTNLLICNDVAEHVNDRQFFQGRAHDISEENYILYWNEELRAHSVNNHVAFLGLKKLVEPVFVGWSGTSHPYDSPPNYQMALYARAQGAAVTYVHPGLPSQYLVDIALGAAETIDVMCQRNEDVNTTHWVPLAQLWLSLRRVGRDRFVHERPVSLSPGGGTRLRSNRSTA